MSATEILGGLKVEGTICGSADVVIYGEVKGEINTESTVTIAKGGKVEGNIHAVNVVIDGEFNGEVLGKESIQVSPNAKAKGNLKAPAIMIERGAQFSGGIEMSPEAQKTTLAVGAAHPVPTPMPTIEQQAAYVPTPQVTPGYIPSTTVS
jgi:cytoskeletal protein CcmA (bactofilin family)